jgi:uncharacterized protein YjdB
MLAFLLSLASVSCGGGKGGGIGVESVSVAPDAMTVVVGHEGSLTATVKPDNASDSGVTWKSSDDEFATVSDDGVVKGVVVGTATITATSKSNGSKTGSCAVTVTAPAEGVSLDKDVLALPLGGSGTLTATVLPDDADRAVTWYSSNQDAATITGSGTTVTINAIAAGSSAVTVTTADGDHTATCSVQVVAQPVGTLAVFVTGPFGLYMDGLCDYNVYGQINDVFVDGRDNVHAVGRHEAEFASQAVHYRNGAMALLPMAFPGANESGARSIEVASDGRVCIAGYEAKNDRRNMVARLWMDGEQSPLHGIDETGVLPSIAETVRVCGGSVYVAGGLVEGGAIRPAIWKDGAKHSFSDISGAYFIDMGINANGTIYAIAYNDDAWNWTMYTVSQDMASLVPVALSGAGMPVCMCVDGADVYAAGWDGSDAYYWKNGARYMIERPWFTNWVEARAIHAYGGHVYIAGCSSRNTTGGSHTELWMDSAFITGDSAIEDEMPSYYEAIPAAIFAKHVAGVPVTDIALSSSALPIPVGYAGTLTATLSPDNATNKRVVWESSDPAVASITGKGLTVTINGLAVGQATITATTAYGPSATCAIDVHTVTVVGVSLPQGLQVGRARTAILTAAIEPPTATNKSIAWTSGDESIATVGGNGLVATVLGVGLGSATITATTQDGGYAANCTVTIAEPTAPAIYVAGGFGLYMDGEYNTPIGDQNLLDVFVDVHGNIHAVGSYRDRAGEIEWSAAHYLNGAPTILEMSHGSDVIETGANSVFVTEAGDVYVAGYEYFQGKDGDGLVARLWKNGAQVPLQGVDETGQVNSYANVVRLHNGVVYVGGYDDHTDGWNHPSIWRDGVQHSNEDMEDFLVMDLDVGANGALWLTCFNTFPGYWGYPDFTAWTVQPDMATWDYIELAGDNLGEPMQTFIEGKDVYYAGRHDNGAYCDPYYWQNGQRYSLVRPTGAYSVEANDIHFLDGHAYIGGRADYNIVQWIDGALLTGPGAIPDTFNFYPTVQGIFAR